MAPKYGIPSKPTAPVISPSVARARKSVFSSFFFFFYGLRLTFFHDRGTCDRHSTKAKHEASHWLHTTTTPPHREIGEHATPPTPWPPRRDLQARTPEITWERWILLLVCYMGASGAHALPRYHQVGHSRAARKLGVIDSQMAPPAHLVIKEHGSDRSAQGASSEEARIFAKVSIMASNLPAALEGDQGQASSATLVKDGYTIPLKEALTGTISSSSSTIMSTHDNDTMESDDGEYGAVHGKKRRKTCPSKAPALQEGANLQVGCIKTDSLSKFRLTDFLNNAAPGMVTVVRVNKARNILAVDVKRPAFKAELLKHRQWASLERAQRVALRICLGVPRTASSRHTLVESGTNTVQNAATERALRHLIRMQESPSTVSLVKNIATRRAHLATLVNLLEEIAGCPTTHITLPPPPSEPPTVTIEMNIAQMGPKSVTPATVAYQHTSQHIDEFYHGWTRTFTDGSVKAQRRTATAAAISEGHSRMEKLSFHASSRTAELEALCLGLAMTDGKQPGNLVLLTDSRAALRPLEKPDRAPALAREPNCPTSEVPAFADARLLTWRIMSARHPELENGPLPAKVPGRLTRNETAVLHRLRTGSAFTPAYLAKWKDHRDDACAHSFCSSANPEHGFQTGREKKRYRQERKEHERTFHRSGEVGFGISQ
ncbi:hypothetical protein HPB47_001402 [Ixodes persulcatus]|uniref:Uncharacterized protein n=1 Tax=Ixodes persulcatus TaxID=34615 RepID=A0AC60PP42_IXOPE|nr:hypothetical protein HPB47_001402 [Ixodes persulcatus]